MAEIGAGFGASRYGIFSLVIFFLSGGILLSRVHPNFTSPDPSP